MECQGQSVSMCDKSESVSESVSFCVFLEEIKA